MLRSAVQLPVCAERILRQISELCETSQARREAGKGGRHGSEWAAAKVWSSAGGTPHQCRSGGRHGGEAEEAQHPAGRRSASCSSSDGAEVGEVSGGASDAGECCDMRAWCRGEVSNAGASDAAVSDVMVSNVVVSDVMVSDVAVSDVVRRGGEQHGGERW